MTFEQFCTEIVENIPKYLCEYNIENIRIDKVTKNNGVTCTGIIILLKGETVAPNIYLDYYYMTYKQGRSLDNVLTMISEEYNRAKSTMDKTDFNLNVDELNDNAIIKLVNYERNKEKLERCPYFRYLDLAITFRFIVKLDDNSVATALISNKDIKRMNISKEQLYDIAMENTRRLFPEIIRCMDELICDIEQICPEEERNKLFVLTNSTGVNGATCLLYEDVIKNFAASKGKSLYILPSSIHEVIIMCCDDVDKERLKCLIKEVNKFVVSEVDYLSDNVYFYDLDTDKITI